MRPYNVPNDRILAPSAGDVEYKQQVAGSHRHWPLVSLQRVCVCGSISSPTPSGPGHGLAAAPDRQLPPGLALMIDLERGESPVRSKE